MRSSENQGDSDTIQNIGDINENSQNYSWAFDGMKIDFLPGSWEVLVTVNNDRLSCEFSSITGGRLLKVKDKLAGKKKKKQDSSKIDQAVNYGTFNSSIRYVYFLVHSFVGLYH